MTFKYINVKVVLDRPSTNIVYLSNFFAVFECFLCIVRGNLLLVCVSYSIRYNIVAALKVEEYIKYIYDITKTLKMSIL